MVSKFSEKEMKLVPAPPVPAPERSTAIQQGAVSVCEQNNTTITTQNSTHRRSMDVAATHVAVV